MSSNLVQQFTPQPTGDSVIDSNNDQLINIIIQLNSYIKALEQRIKELEA